LQNLRQLLGEQVVDLVRAAEVGSDGTVDIDVAFESVDQACVYLLGSWKSVEAVDPQVRQAMARAARGASHAYRTRTGRTDRAGLRGAGVNERDEPAAVGDGRLNAHPERLG
jgi:hypothetical protein